MNLSRRATVLSFLFLILFVQLAVAQTTPERAQAIRAAIDVADWKTARTEIEKLKSTDLRSYNAGSYDYLLGRIAEQTGSTANATAVYESVVTRNSILAEYSLWRLARIARSSGDLVLERERLRQLVSSAPTSLLHDAATLRLAESFFESRDYADAAASARSLSVSKNASLARQGLALLGQSLVREGKVADARDVFTKLLMQMPDASRPDDFALTAVRELDDLDKSADASATPMSEADHLLRASVYQFNRDFAAARSHYQIVVDRFPLSGTVPNALYQLGRGLYLEGKYLDAINVFQKTYNQSPQSPSARDALSYTASSYLRLKRFDDALAANKLFLERFPDAPNPERTYLNVIDALHEASRYAEALDWVQQTRTRFRNQLGSTLALFAQMRIHLAQNSWVQVVADADELLKASDLGGTRVAGGTTAQEVSFLRAVALEQAGRLDDAISGYLAIPAGRNEYYGTRATFRLLSLASNEKTRNIIRTRLNSALSAAKSANAAGQNEQARMSAQTVLRLTDDQSLRSEALQILQAAYGALPPYKLPSFQIVQLSNQPGAPSSNDAAPQEHLHRDLADALISLGLYDEGLPELFVARSVTTQKVPPSTAFTDEDYTIAVYSLRGGIPNRAVRFAEQVWKAVPADYVLEVAPRDLLELLYPAPFRELLVKHAPSRSIDPRFVLSIARQESRYQSDAKSVAAARGMMQFIASTASEVATQLKLEKFQQDDLYNPDTAILFGSQYLSSLFQQFPGQPDAVAAAYNGGADNIARWIGRSHATEPDRYVAEIGFAQTKDYVFKVMSNFWNYQILFDAQLKPR